MRIKLDRTVARDMGKISGEEELNMTRLVNEVLREYADKRLNEKADEALDARLAKEITNENHNTVRPN